MVINVAWFLFYWEPEREVRSVILLIQGFGGLVPLGPTGRTPAILQCVGRAEGKKYTTSIQLFRNAAPPAQPELFVCYHCDMQSQAAIQQQTYIKAKQLDKVLEHILDWMLANHLGILSLQLQHQETN